MQVVGSQPTAIALGPEGSNRAYVAGNNGVSVINTATNQVLSTVTTGGGQSYGIAVFQNPNGQHRVYVSMTGNNRVAVINATTSANTAYTLGNSVAVGSTPTGVAVSPDGSRVYVANWSGGSVSVLNGTTATPTVVRTISVGTNPIGVAVSPNGTRVYVSKLGNNNVSVIDPVASTPVVATVAVGTQPFGLPISPDGSLVYTANGNDTVSMINTKTNAVIRTVTIDSAPETNWHGIGVSPDGRQIYIGDMSDAAVRVLTLVHGNSAPVAGTPTVGSPNAATGAVSGALNFTDPDGDALSYSVTPPATGTVTVTSAGVYTYTPTQAARHQAAQTPEPDNASFTVTASDGQAAQNVSVTVPISPNAIQSTPYLPFDMPVGQTDVKVFAHYVPWFPVSIDNLPAEQDYYTIHYLTPTGENGIHAAYGGLVRDRPLPRTPINDPDWRYLDIVNEVHQAKSVGIDGFAVDIVVPSTQNEAITNLLRAAQSTNDFSIQITADMAGPLGTYTSADFASEMAPYLASPGAQRLSDGRVVLGAFYAERQSAAWWNNTLGILRDTYGVNAAFVPTFLDAQSNMNAFAPVSYGFGNWGGRNPLNTNPANTNPGTQVDLVRQAHALGKIWMQPVAFQDNRPREGIFDESGNTLTNSNMWQIAINEDAEWVQLLTWNDYAEATQMAPSVDHGSRMLDMQAYSIAQYKYGITPTVLRDALYVSHRSQPADAESTYQDTITMEPRPGTPQPIDTVDVVVFATAPATIVANIGGVVSSCAVGGGRSVCSFPLHTGNVIVSMERNGTTQMVVQSPYAVTDTPYVQDLEYNIAGGLR